MRALNRQFRGKDKVTDVLSFPAETRGFLGDVVIAGGVATKQARAAGHPCKPSCASWPFTVCYIFLVTITSRTVARWLGGGAAEEEGRTQGRIDRAAAPFDSLALARDEMTPLLLFSWDVP
jgi:hypothetical protein